jgi:predicted Zn-ribbon and HTH transcriptional regulator
MYNKRELRKSDRKAVKSNPWAKDKAVIPGAPKVDSNGYWDPSNIGRQVEISSNRITMTNPDGSPLGQDLIGVGKQTGNVQYMQDGMDYIFYGDQAVIEHPKDEFMYLDDREIKAYRDGGYIVEELPQAQPGGHVSQATHLANQAAAMAAYNTPYLISPGMMYYPSLGYAKPVEPNLDTDLSAYLKSVDQPNSYEDRKKLYESTTNKTDYKGTADQNIGLLKLVKEQSVPKKEVAPSTNTTVTGVPPEQNTNPNQKYVGTADILTQDENGNPVHTVEHKYTTDPIVTAPKKEEKRTQSRGQTVMKVDPNNPGKYIQSDIRQVPYSEYTEGKGWSPVHAPGVIWINPEGQEVEIDPRKTTAAPIIIKQKQGGYIADETYYPPKHNPANSFAVNDPRSMSNGGRYNDAAITHYEDGGNKRKNRKSKKTEVDPKYNFDRLKETNTIQNQYSNLPLDDPRRVDWDKQMEAYNQQKAAYDQQVKDFEQQSRLYNWSQRDKNEESAIWDPDYESGDFNDPRGIKANASWYNYMINNPDRDTYSSTEEMYTPYYQTQHFSGTNFDDLYKSFNERTLKPVVLPYGVSELDQSRPYDGSWAIQDLIDKYSKFPNFTGMDYSIKPSTDYTTNWVRYRDNVTKTHYGKPITPNIEHDYTYEGLKKIWPNLTEKSYNESFYNSGKVRLWKDSLDNDDSSVTIDDLKELKGKTYKIVNGKKYYIPDNVDLDIKSHEDYYPSFKEPEQVEPFTETSPNDTFEEEEAVNTLAQQYDSKTGKWVDIVTPKGSQIDNQTKERENWKQKNIEGRKKKKLNWTKGRYSFEDGGYSYADLSDEEISQYRRGGFVIDELHQAQNGETTGTGLTADDYYNNKIASEKAYNDYLKKIEAEKARVAKVKGNIIPAAQRLDEADNAYNSYNIPQWASKEEQNQWINYISAKDPKALAAAQKALSPKLKSLIPAQGNYNVAKWDSQNNEWVDGADPDRELYCTPYGCFAYQNAGAYDVPTIGGNIDFASGAASGKYPFEKINPNERQPGDMALLKEMSPINYMNRALGNTRRPHHTTIYSGPGKDPKDVESMIAYNANDGQRLMFGLDEFKTDEKPADAIDYYRYVGQMPKYEKELERLKQEKENAARGYETHSVDGTSLPLNELTPFSTYEEQEIIRQPERKLEEILGLTKNKKGEWVKNKKPKTKKLSRNTNRYSFQDGGNKHPGNNALELHMFYDKDVYKKQGGVLTQAQKGITISDPKEYAYRKAAYNDSLSGYNKTQAVLRALDNLPINDVGTNLFRNRHDIYDKADEAVFDFLGTHPNIEPVSYKYTEEYLGLGHGWGDHYPLRTGIPIYEKPKQPVYKPEREPLPEWKKLPIKHTETPALEIIPQTFKYTPKKQESIEVANRGQTVMEPDPDRPGKYRVKEMRQVPYAAKFPGEGTWEPANAPRVIYVDAEGNETEERPGAQLNTLNLQGETFKQGGSQKNNNYFSYEGRPDAKYMKKNDGWYINAPGTDGQYIKVEDPTGSRTKLLNEQAVYHSEDKNPQPSFILELNNLKAKRDKLYAQNNGLGPSSMSDMIRVKDIVQEIGELESEYQDKLQSTPMINKSNAIGTMSLTAGKYLAPKPLQKAMDIFLNVQDAKELYNNPSDELNQANTSSDILSSLQSKKTQLKPFSVAGDLITIKQKADQFNNATNDSYTIKKQGGALLTKKVTCKKCGWEWDAADGGNDITTCHKCGGQGIVHAEEGGLLPKADNGGNNNCPEGFQEDPVTGDCMPISEKKQDVQEVPNSIVQKPLGYQEPLVNPTAYVNGYRGNNPKMYKYGFLDSDQGNIIGGGGFGFPKPGVHLSALGVVPISPNDRQYFKGVYEAGISKDFKNLNLGLGVNTAITGYPGENGFVKDPIKLQPKLNLRYNFQEGGGLPKAQYAGTTFNHPDAGATNVLFQKPVATKPNSKYDKKAPVNYQEKLKPVVADNTRDVTADQTLAAIQNAAYMESPEYKAKQKAEKEAQAKFEKEQWDKYNKMSFGEKVSDRTNAALNQWPVMLSNTIAGEQAYIPGMASGLGDGGPDYDKWLKATGQTRGLSINDAVNAFNPGNWGGHAGREYGEGNYLTGAGELGLGLLGLKGAPLMGNELAKRYATNLIELEKLGTPIKNYASDFYQTSKQAGKPKLPTYKSTYRVEPTDFKKDEWDDLSGRWFVDNPEDANFYVKNLKSDDPNASVRIMKEKMLQDDYARQFGENMPDAAKEMSIGTGAYESIDDLVAHGKIDPFTALNWRTNNLTQKDFRDLSLNKFAYNKTEGILNDAYVQQLRNLSKNNKFAKSSKFEFGDKDSATNYLIEQIQGIRKNKFKEKYLPFEEGGSYDSENDEGEVGYYTDEEIAQMRADGYIVKEE